MADPIPPPPPSGLQQRSLLKHRSWSPDTEREEAWQRRKDLHRARRTRGRLALRSVTDDDFDELRGCLDLGIDFGDGSPGGGACPKRLAEILPALDLYWSVRKALPEETASDCSSESESSSLERSPDASPLSIFASGNNPAEMKASLKRWAKVVAFAVQQR